jgi:hypothetical protein
VTAKRDPLLSTAFKDLHERFRPGPPIVPRTTALANTVETSLGGVAIPNARMMDLQRAEAVAYMCAKRQLPAGEGVRRAEYQGHSERLRPSDYLERAGCSVPTRCPAIGPYRVPV